MRAHPLLCMLAYYLEFHMRRRLAPLLFAEEGGPEPGASAVAPLERSPAAKRKDCTRETLDGRLPLQSFPDLLASLSTLTTVELVYEQVPDYVLPALSAMTPLQSEAFKLLGVKPHPAPSLARPGATDPSPAADT